jgi:hypothetical protein
MLLHKGVGRLSPTAPAAEVVGGVDGAAGWTSVAPAGLLHPSFRPDVAYALKVFVYVGSVGVLAAEGLYFCAGVARAVTAES